MKYIVKVFVLISLVAIGVSCKKKEEATPVRDKLVGKWQGDTATPTVSALGIDLGDLNKPYPIDSVTLDLMADGSFTSTSGSQTATGKWSVENETKIKLEGFTFALPIVGSISLDGLKIPDTYDIKEITDSRLVLKASLSQNVTLPGFPIPIAVSGNIELSFNKK